MVIPRSFAVLRCGQVAALLRNRVDHGSHRRIVLLLGILGECWCWCRKNNGSGEGQAFHWLIPFGKRKGQPTEPPIDMDQEPSALAVPSTLRWGLVIAMVRLA
jgi:hypothetical protein